MCILADKQVKESVKRGDITIDPYFTVFQGPNCYHCHLGNRFMRISRNYLSHQRVFDPLVNSSGKLYESFTVDKSYDLQPGEFLLAEIFEYLGTNKNYVIKLFNSSSLARIGISQAALGMINAGCGMETPIKLTLELINNSPIPIRLRPTKFTRSGKINWGTEVLKISVMKMDKPPENPYDKWKFGVYSGDRQVSGTKMAKRFDDQNLFLPSDSFHLRRDLSMRNKTVTRSSVKK